MTSREHNRYEYYKGHYYANKLRVNNKNEHDTNNGTNQQYEPPNMKTMAQTNNMKPPNMKIK